MAQSWLPAHAEQFAAIRNDEDLRAIIAKTDRLALLISARRVLHNDPKLTPYCRHLEHGDGLCGKLSGHNLPHDLDRLKLVNELAIGSSVFACVASLEGLNVLIPRIDPLVWPESVWH